MHYKPILFPLVLRGNLFLINKVMETSNSAKTILRAGLVAGTCDLSAAIIVYAFILQRMSTLQLLQSIASGIFGKDAYAGGTEMAILGVIFHYIIAMIFAVAYFLIFPKIPFLRQQKVISGLLYGVIVWFMMNLIVLPMSHATSKPFEFSINTFRGMAILMVCIGLPISLIVHKFYAKSNH
jgi:hypothetical protein